MEKMVNEFQKYCDENPNRVNVIDMTDELVRFNAFVEKIQRANALKRQRSWESASKVYVG
ncbi:hypothetical protein AGMMS49965_25400 [Bacteroidia bacterium]|nr:hypothetical protein AGMMS49965_25400 [Bacteroidia bacterium]